MRRAGILKRSRHRSLLKYLYQNRGWGCSSVVVECMVKCVSGSIPATHTNLYHNLWLLLHSLSFWIFLFWHTHLSHLVLDPSYRPFCDLFLSLCSWLQQFSGTGMYFLLNVENCYVYVIWCFAFCGLVELWFTYSIKHNYSIEQSYVSLISFLSHSIC